MQDLLYEHCSECGRCPSIGQQVELTTMECARRANPVADTGRWEHGQVNITVQDTTTSSNVRRNPVYGNR